MPDQSEIILASKSVSRKKLMSNAGLDFKQHVSSIDEEIIKQTFLKSGEPQDLPMILAQAKAMTVSEKFPDSWVIGSDQVLLFNGKVYDKPKSDIDARDQLLELRGNQHQLETAVCIVKNKELMWSVSDSSYLTMRDFSPVFLGKYLAAEGENVTTSVGGYKLEGLGLQLFDKIDGDFFTILGLPMLKLLSYLRQQNLIET